MAESGGQPGNKNASKNKVWIAALNRAVAQDDGKKLRNAAEKLLELAAAGDIAAIRELGDRLDGKAHQSTSIENSDGTPIFSGITVTFAKSDSPVPGKA